MFELWAVRMLEDLGGNCVMAFSLPEQQYIVNTPHLVLVLCVKNKLVASRHTHTQIRNREQRTNNTKSLRLVQ